MRIEWQSIVTCPQCGFQQEEVMPADYCVVVWECPQCRAQLKPKPGDCCVYCSYGTQPCPPVQMDAPGSCCGGVCG